MPDPERVARYWPSAQHNIGIACGPSQLIVVDLDTHGHLPEDWRDLPGVRDGRDVLAQLAEWAGQPWPSTYMVATANGGWHLYFTAPEGSGIRNSASLLGPQVDVRAVGGYVIAAGSEVDGKPYEVLSAGDAEPLPGWIRQLLAPVAAPSVPASRRGAPPGARMEGLLATVRSGKAGDRNNPLYWASRRAAEMIAAGEVAREDVEEALVGAVLEAGLRGGEPEARRTFASAMRGQRPVSRVPSLAEARRRAEATRRAKPDIEAASGPATIRALREAIDAGTIPGTYVSNGRVVVVEKVSGTAGAVAGDEDSPLPVTASEVRAPGLAALLAEHTFTYRIQAGRQTDGGTETYEEEVTPPTGVLAAALDAEGMARAPAAVRHRRRPGPAARREPAAAARLRPGDLPVPGQQGAARAGARASRPASR